MNQVSPTAFHQLRAGKTLTASRNVSSVDCSPHSDEAEESSSSLTKLANSATPLGYPMEVRLTASDPKLGAFSPREVALRSADGL